MIDTNIYILDNDMKIIKIDEPLENIQTTELPEDRSLIKNYVHVSVEIDEKTTDHARFIAMKAKNGNDKSFELFEIVDETTGNDSTDFVAIDVGVREAGGYIIKDFRPSDRTIRYVAEKILEETDWRVGYIDSDLANITTNFYYLTVKDSLVKLQQTADAEIVFRVEINENEVTDKWIEIHKRIGKRQAHRFEYGTSALEVVRQSSISELYTALIGRGKGEESGDGYGRKITFENVEARDKPLGQEYIENEVATAIYGIRTMNGMARRTGIVEFDTDDETELLNLTRQTLEYASRPKSEFKTTVAKIGDADIGDSATIHKYEIGLHYETRIRKVVRDRLNNLNTDLVLGDYVHDSATRKQAKANSTIKNIEIEQDEQREVIGNVIQRADGMATITYGPNEPDKKRVGDLWYRPDPADPTKTQIVIWNGDSWEKTTDTEKLEQDIKNAKEAVEAVEETANKTAKEISDSLAGTDYIRLSDLIASKITDGEASTLFFQKAKDIGLAYEENGEVKAMIGIVNGNIFQQGEQIMFKGDDIIADGTLTVTEDMFAEGITFDWAKGQTLDVNDITLVNLNMENIAGGNIELSDGFKITNNGHEVLSIDAQTGKVIFDVANIPTKDEMQSAIDNIELKEGPSGKTAYEIALEQGFVGTKQEWLDSLHGKDGTPGNDGEPTYTWIKYADTPTSGMSDNPEDKKYIGMAFNKKKSTGTTNYRDYQWSLMPQNIEIGGRNYFSQSNYSHHSNAGYKASSWTSAVVEAEPNTEYTISYTVTESNRFGVVHDPLSNGINATYTDMITLISYKNTTEGQVIEETVTTPNREGYLVLYLSNERNDIKEPHLMVEKGNTPTDWTPAPEDTEEKINKKADTETVDNIDQRLSGNEAMTEVQSEELQTLEQNLQDYREMLETNVVDAETALAEIDTLIQREVAIQENLGNLTREMNFVNTQILYGDEGMYIQHIDKETGSSGNTGIRITDHSIDFMDGDKRVAYITGQVLYINHGIFVESAKIGEHLIETINGQTIFTWIE